MNTLRDRYDSLYSRIKNDKLNEDDLLFSLDDIYSSKRTTSSTSIVNAYAFSDDEEGLHGSLHGSLLESLYFDDVPAVDMDETTTTKKDTTGRKQSATRGGALEELFAPAGSLKSSNTKDGPLSSPNSRSLPAMLGPPDNQTSFSARGNYVWEVDQDDRERDTDDEGLEFGSDSNEVSLLHRKSAIRGSSGPGHGHYSS